MLLLLLPQMTKPVRKLRPAGKTKSAVGASEKKHQLSFYVQVLRAQNVPVRHVPQPKRRQLRRDRDPYVNRPLAHRCNWSGQSSLPHDIERV